jgi:hypothetical protein
MSSITDTPVRLPTLTVNCHTAMMPLPIGWGVGPKVTSAASSGQAVRSSFQVPL